MPTQKTPKNIFFLLIVILGLSAFFRFYHLADLFYFSLDEEVISYHVSRIVTGVHFPAIGVNAADTGLYLGPGYFYLAAPFFWAAQNHPLAGAVMSSLIGVIATAAIYWAGTTIFNRQTGLLAALLHASSLTVALFERKFFNPQPAVLVASLLMLGAFWAGKNKSKGLLVASLSAAASLHLNLMLVPLIFGAVVYLLYKKPQLPIKTWLASMAILALSLSPVIIFELRHGFAQTQAAYHLLTGQKAVAQPQTKSNPFIDMFKFVPKIIAQQPDSTNIVTEYVTHESAPKNPPHPLAIVLVIFGLAGLLRGFNSDKLILVSLILIPGATALLIYPGVVREYYRMVLTAPLLLAAGFGLWQLANFNHAFKYLIFTLLIGSISFNLFFLSKAENIHSLSAMEQAAKPAVKLLTGEFSLTKTGDTGYGYGFDYLFDHYGYPSSQSFSDPVIGWLRHPDKDALPTQTLIINAYRDSLKIEVSGE